MCGRQSIFFCYRIEYNCKMPTFDFSNELPFWNTKSEPMNSDLNAFLSIKNGLRLFILFSDVVVVVVYASNVFMNNWICVGQVLLLLVPCFLLQSYCFGGKNSLGLYRSGFSFFFLFWNEELVRLTNIRPDVAGYTSTHFMRFKRWSVWHTIHKMIIRIGCHNVVVVFFFLFFYHFN